MRSSRGVVATVVAVLAISVGSSCVASSSPDSIDSKPPRDVGDTIRSGVLFPAPASTGSEERNGALRRLVGLIDRTPRGETIRIVAYTFSYQPVARALAAAHERGVVVQVLADRENSRGFDALDQLERALGTNRRSGSFVYRVRGDLHQKTWSFSRTGQRRDVVMVGSMNLTYKSARQFNNVVVYVDRPDVRRVFDRRFTHLLEDLPNVRAYGPAVLGRDTAWFLPGPTGTEDPFIEQLRGFDAEGGRIRVAMFAWLYDRGLAVADLLATKAAAGADVQIVLGSSVGPQVRAVLREADIEVYRGRFPDGTEIHHKFTILDPADGQPVVLTGSDNFTPNSLIRPEVLLRVTGRKRVDRFAEHFDRLVKRARRLS